MICKAHGWHSPEQGRGENLDVCRVKESQEREKKKKNHILRAQGDRQDKPSRDQSHSRRESKWTPQGELEVRKACDFGPGGVGKVTS